LRIQIGFARITRLRADGQCLGNAGMRDAFLFSHEVSLGRNE
jgi:hypothetical protein